MLTANLAASLTPELATALLKTQALLTEFATQPDFLADLQVAFGSNVSALAALELQQQWLQADFNQMPLIEVRTAAELRGAFGAYSALTNTIYISQQLLEPAFQDQLVAVLLEEIGHSLDSQLSLADSLGDEGELFSGLARGQTFTIAHLAALQGQDDQIILNLDGALIPVETSSLIGEAVEVDVRFTTFADAPVDVSLFSTTFTVGAGQEVTNQGVSTTFQSSGFDQTLSGNVSIDVGSDTIFARFNGTAQPGQLKFIFSSLVGGPVSSVDSATETANSGVIGGVNATLAPTVASNIVTTGFTPFGFQPGTNITQTVQLGLAAAANTPPTTKDADSSLEEDAIVSFNSGLFPFEDSDAAGALQGILVVSLPTKGQFFVDANMNSTQDAGEAVAAGDAIALSELNQLKYIPNANGYGENFDSFQFQVFDGLAYSNTSTFTFNQDPVNDAPVLANDTTFTAIAEDVLAASNNGNTITELLGTLVTDVDFDPQGIAVTNVDNTNGTWEYSTNGGTTWTAFGNSVTGTNAVTLGATSLYSGYEGTAPSNQGWLALANVVGATETVELVGTTLDTTAIQNIYAGYSNYNGMGLVNPNFPRLNHNEGYRISFNLQVLNDAQSNPNRAGFSLVVVSDDPTKAIEIAFQDDQIFAQDDSPLFVADPAATVAFDTTQATQYALAVQGNNYTLFANGSSILTGTLRDYASFMGAIDPYETPNFLFLGDDSTSAQGRFRLNQVAVETETRVRFVPAADYTGDASLQFRAWDTTDGSNNGDTGVDASQTGGENAFSTNQVTGTVTVNAVNDAPTLSNLNGDTVTHTVGPTATPLDAGSDSVISDVDSNNFDGGTLTVTVTNKVAGEDLLTLSTTGNITLSGTTAGSTVSVAGTVVGTLANAIAADNDLVINLDANATPGNVPALLRALQYQNIDVPNPNLTARSLQVTLTDGDGGTATASTVTVNLQTAPEIDILGNGVTVTDGDTTPSPADDTDFGPQAVTAGSVTQTFTINNLGSNDLVLSGSPLVQLSDNTHFSVSKQPASFASVGGSTTFDITFDPAAVGFHSTTVTVTSNDSDEGTYTFDLQGYGQPFVVINEIDADTAGTDALEFVELYDGGAGNTALDGLVLVFYNGNDDQSYRAFDLDGQVTNANGYFVLGNAGVANVDFTFPNNTLQNGADAVALHFGNATDFPNNTAINLTTVIDAVVYDTNDADDAGLLPLLTAGGQLNEDADSEKDTQSLQRIPNGGGNLRDTSSFTTLTPTPGAANLTGVEFTQAIYTSSEGDGTSNVVTVTRGSAIGPASVQIAVQGASTAIGGSDYDNSGFPITVTFANGEVSKTVAIPLTDDVTVEGNETLVLGLQNPISLTLGSQTTTTLNITDNDSPGFTIVESGSTTQVDESGTTDTFTVVLNTQPLSDVELEIATKTKSKVGDEATFTPTTLTFTAANWDQAQTVTVTGVDDDRDDGDQTNTLIISVVEANSDNAFDALPDQTVTVTTTDNDTAGITLTESGSSTAVTEGGATDSYTVVLDSQPTDTVTINLTPDAQTQLDKATVTFTPADWDQAQTVMVTAVDDAAIEGSHTSTISAAVTSGDAKYDSLTLAPLTVAVTDDDIQTVNLAVSANNGTEAAGTVITVTATADGAVNGDQTVDLAIAGSNITASDYSLSNPVITILDGQTTGTATFTVLDDALVEGLETATLSLSNPSAGLLLGATTNQQIAIADNDNAATIFNFEQWVSYTTIRRGQTYQSALVNFNIEIGGLRIAPLFDETDYLSDNPDVAAAVQQGVYRYGFEHFVLFGINEGRSPSDWFDTDYYLAQNADVAAAVGRGETTAIAHFLISGHRENRDPSAFFDASDYLLNNPDVKAAVDAGLLDSGFEHYIEAGAEEGRLNGLLFEESFYLQQNADVAAAVQSGQLGLGLYHFLSFGQSEGRDPSAAFDQSAYLERYSDVAAAVASGVYASGFEHYVLFGRAEGRVAV